MNKNINKNELNIGEFKLIYLEGKKMECYYQNKLKNPKEIKVTKNHTSEQYSQNKVLSGGGKGDKKIDSIIIDGYVFEYYNSNNGYFFIRDCENGQFISPHDIKIELKPQTNIFLMIIGVVILVIIFLIYFGKKKVEKNQEIKQKNQKEEISIKAKQAFQ